MPNDSELMIALRRALARSDAVTRPARMASSWAVLGSTTKHTRADKNVQTLEKDAGGAGHGHHADHPLLPLAAGDRPRCAQKVPFFRSCVILRNSAAVGNRPESPAGMYINPGGLEGVRVRINRFTAPAKGVRVWQFTVLDLVLEMMEYGRVRY